MPLFFNTRTKALNGIGGIQPVEAQKESYRDAALPDRD
jgi:hypothetical protein